MSNYKRLCSIVLAITVLLTSLIFQGFNVFADTKEGIINGTDVALRSEPNTGSSSVRIEKFNLNERVTILETVVGNEPSSEAGHGTTWYKVRRSSGQEGYVYGFYVTLITPPVPSDENFENFPESYRTALKQLKAIYPKSTFVPDNLNITFNEAVNIQFTTAQRKQIEAKFGLSWRSMHYKAYNWENGTYYNENGGWVSASKSIISYYLDPRNFLNYDTAFMFVQQSYNSTQTADMVKTAVAGTFLANGYDGNPDAYINDILEAARQTGVSPLVLAATIIVEQGPSGTSSLISGTYPNYQGYYNFFNIGASGVSSADVIVSGLQTAKNNGWNTRRAAIIGGASSYADGYISVGQDTFYYKNFNFVYDYPSRIWHQYAQSIYDAYNNGLRLKKGYEDIPNENITLTFRIPVFKDMPATAAEKPLENNNQNNFYLTQMNVSGLNPAFDMFTQNYSLSVNGNTTVYVKVPNGASVVSKSTFDLAAGPNLCVITVKAQTGYTNDYSISVNAAAPCTLTVTTNDPGTPPDTPTQPTPPTEPEPPVTDEPVKPTLKKGDINGDGIIDVLDLGLLKRHCLEIEIFTDEKIYSADINADNIVDVLDLGKLKRHVLEIELITN